LAGGRNTTGYQRAAASSTNPTYTYAEVEEGTGMSGTEFHEPWVDDIPATEPPRGLSIGFTPGVNRVMEVHTVFVDGHAIVPLPDSRDRFSTKRWGYGFGKIVELYSDSAPASINGLDTILRYAGVKVRD
jgi:hypothetical protein